MIADVFHFSFTVSDIDRSVAWYTDILGLELVARQSQANAYTSTLVGFEDAALEVAQLRLPDLPPARSTHMLELVQYVAPRGRRRTALPTNDVGAAHLALMVTDVSARYERMCAAGVRFRSAPVRITEGVNAGGMSCYLLDPDGITLELLQPPDGRLCDMGLMGD